MHMKARAPYYYLVIEANGVSETVKASPIKQTAIALAQTYYAKHRRHNVSVRMEKIDSETGVADLVEVWSSKSLSPAGGGGATSKKRK